MYIGPWQEFDLSKKRNRNSESEKNKLIHKNLVSILENSLDPAAAQQAIQAINPYLNDVSEPTFKSDIPQQNAKSSSATRFPRVIPRDRRVKSYRHIRRSGDPPRHQQHALPLILSARNSYDNNGPPSNRSIMSTNSEPIQGTVYTPDKKIPPVRLAKLQADTKQANHKDGYDPTNVRDILKIERNASKNTGQTKQSDLSGFWKWKQAGKPLPPTFSEGCNGSISGKTKSKSNAKNNPEINKAERLDRMRQMYSQRDGDSQEGISSFQESEGNTVEKTTPTKQNHAGNLQLSPIRSPRAVRGPYSKPSTPIVKDKELTDMDMAVISKYFHKNQNDYNSRTQHRLSSQRLRSPSPSPSPQIRRTPGHQMSALMPHTPHKSRATSQSPPPRSRSNNLGNSSHTLDREAASVVQGEQMNGHYQNGTNMEQQLDIDTSKLYTEQADEGFVTAEEGLLDWCTNLDVDNIDDMY
mmetsp:Transcript_8503/g.14418  ORF Transcript_8503/g.14418 Transcript_8503/m.14418 type:complete len:468 (-) Transcript_8503:61-1464(-)